MAKRQLPSVTVTLDKIVGGGQALATMHDGSDEGRKLFVWGGLPGEKVTVQLTKKKSKMAEGVVTEVLEASDQRITPLDEGSYLSTSPWQIMTPDAETHYKKALIEEAFELHDIMLPEAIEFYSPEEMYHYRNKMEFSFWWDNDSEQLDLAFFRRGSHGKLPVDGSALAMNGINEAAVRLRDILRKRSTSAYDLKTVIIRESKAGEVVAQLYVKNEEFELLDDHEIESLNIQGFELIFSNPKSPASVITQRLQKWGNVTLDDTILDVPFHYAAEGFFQINLPVYEQTLRDMKEWIHSGKPTLDLYSGVGSIGLTIGEAPVTLVEINEHAVREMERNIASLGRDNDAHAVLAASENALDHVTTEQQIILDPPRAGLHEDVINKLLEAEPSRIIYLSCNPVTQARDVALLAEKYGIRTHKGYNFFPRTPHIEHLVILDRKP